MSDSSNGTRAAMALQPAAAAELRRGMCVGWVMVAEVSLETFFFFFGQIRCQVVKINKVG